MTFLDLAFVDAPSPTANVAVSLTGDQVYLSTFDSFSLGTPTYEAEPDAVGGLFGWRTVSFELTIVAPYSDATGIMQDISRELLQPRNWLRVQRGPETEAMFLRTYRTPQGAVSWTKNFGDVWTLPVSLVCDAELTGNRVDLPAQTATNAATGTNDMVVTLAGIKGDFQTPAIVWTSTSDASMMARLSSSVRPPVLVEAETYASIGPQSTAITSTATYSNSGGVLLTPVSTSTNLVGTWTMPATLQPGTYQVLVRCKLSVAAVGWSGYMWGITGLGSDTGATAFTPDGTTTAMQLVDMGTIQIPDRRVGSVPVAPFLPTFNLTVTRAATASGTLGVDYFAFIPAGPSEYDRTATVTGAVVAYLPSSSPLVFDGTNFDDWAGYVYTPSTSIFDPAALMQQIPPADVSGGMPLLTPGVTNYLTYLRMGNGILLTKQSPVYVSYFPKYLHLAPDAT